MTMKARGAMSKREYEAAEGMRACDESNTRA